MRRLLVSFVIASTWTAACGGDDGASERAVARNFDELARAVAACADDLHECNDEDAGADAAEACRDEFLKCRADAGKKAENSLADEIATCQEGARACRADASSDARETRCSSVLRACLGEARGEKAPKGDAGRPTSHPPTYQCFGQLRECVTSEAEPQKCAAEARACVIAAVGEPPVVRRPRPAPSMPNAGSGPRGGAGAGASAAGGAGKAGARAAGSGGGGGRASGASGASGATGAGAAGRGGRGAADDVQEACKAEHEACLMRGEKPMTCAKEQKRCAKGDE